MRSIAIILSLVIAAFTAQPLISEILHHRVDFVCCHAEESSESDTSEHSTHDCCDIPIDHSQDDTDHNSCQNCSCSMHINIVCTLAITPGIHIYETLLEKTEDSNVPYSLVLAPRIWHPPQV